MNYKLNNIIIILIKNKAIMFSQSSKYFDVSNPSLYESFIEEIHISLSYKLEHNNFPIAYRSNTKRDFYRDLWKFIKNYDNSKKFPRIKIHGFDDNNRKTYLYLHIKMIDENGHNVQKSVGKKLFDEYLDDLLKALDEKYSTDFCKFSIMNLKEIISRKFKNPSFSMMATYHYMKKHNDNVDDILPTLNMILPIINNSFLL